MCLLSFLSGVLLAITQARADQFVIDVQAGGNAPDPIDVALNAEREHRSAVPTDTIVLEFAAGVFRRGKPIMLGAADSGTTQAPLIIRGAADGGTTISGAIIVPKSRPEAYSRPKDPIHTAARAPILVSREALGLDKPLAVTPRGTYSAYEHSRVELFQGNRRLRLARWPKKGYSTDITPIDAKNNSGPVRVSVPSEQLARWRGETHAWLGGYLAYDWDYETAPIRPIERDHMSLIFDRLPSEFPVRKHFRYFLFNALSELDEPGEYVIDPVQQTVRLLAFDENQPVESAVVDTLLHIENVSHLIIENVAFEKTLGTAISVGDSKNISFADCFVGHSGGDAIHVLQSNDVVIDRCLITDISERGIVLSGGDRQNLTPANDIIRNSIVTRFGVDSPAYRPGIAIIGVGMTVEGCAVGNGPHSGIIITGNENRIVRNELFSLVQETLDAGAIYMGRDWTHRGNVFSENYFHDIEDDRSGIYLDDQISGSEITDNVFARVGRPVVIGGGRDTVVKGNVFIAPLTAGIWVDNRGQTWQKSAFEPNSQWMLNLKKVNIAAPVWRSKYPTLGGILTDEPGAPKNTVIDNVSIDGNAIEFHGQYAERYVQYAGSIEIRTSTKLTSPTSSEIVGVLLGLAADASGAHLTIANNYKFLKKLLFFRKASLHL